MFCRLLGPLEVRAGESWTGIGAPKWRALLAVLLLRPGQVVSTGQLADELWGASPPKGARKLISGYAARLRQLIGDPDGRVLVTTAPGYRLLVDPADLDAPQFERLLTVARAALDRADGERAASLLDEALALWRGPALVDVPPGPLIAAEAARLDELRLDAFELRAEARIGCDRAAELVAELRLLTAEYPLRERFWHQLMRALELSGRPAEALEAYARVQKILAEELGADPGRDLQQLHGRLLSGVAPAPTVKPAAAPSAIAAPDRAVPRQLPFAAAHFAGRARELSAVSRLLDQARADQPGTVVISAIDGMPGVGKTALAVQAGHLLAHRYPDRQLFVDLHGLTPGREPADPADVLAMLLAADGVDPQYLPASLDGRAAMWRDRLAGQRSLLILDNAASSAQVAPLLPGTAGCLVLVTSRRFLGDLPVTLEVPLDVLPRGDATVMFTDLAPRAANDPDQVADLVELCGRLPLAIMLLARLFARHRSWTMADLIGQTRTRLLAVTVENRTVTAAFEASYQDLDFGRRRFFRLLGLHPGPEIDAFAAAALTGLPLAEATVQLNALFGDRLLEEPAPGRYRLHDLIRQYARSLAAGDPDSERKRAIDRLLDYYQHTALVADAHLARHARPATDRVPAPTSAPDLPDWARAHAWMTAERASLTACIEYAITCGDQARVTGLIAAIAAPLRSDGPRPRAVALHAAAAQAARDLGDERGQANALLNLGDLRYLSGDNVTAADALAQARDIYRRIGDQLGEANALHILGVAQQQLPDGLPAAIELTRQALDIYRAIGDRLGEANSLSSLGIMRRLTGDYPGATGPLEGSLEIFREIGGAQGEATALRGLADVWQVTGEYQDAVRLMEQALEISREAEDRFGEAYALFGIGSVRQLTGDYAAATLALEQAMHLHRSIGSRRGEAYACGWLGDSRRALGDFPGATESLEASLDLCCDIGDRIGEAYALLGLGRVRRAVEDLPGATGFLKRALDIFGDLGDLGGEMETLIDVGAVHLARTDSLRARACYQRALKLARAAGTRLEEAYALEGLGRCAEQTRDARAADTARRQALEIYQCLGTTDATRLKAEMAPTAM
ncbi:MAG TPA: BTAD domain-containing putative transcriptional regulator [Streptosporangiaceae bacterium]|nr:BTAD domain-containing putative transcriptional regulator [Streptosporangiaceae bacterium]